MDGVCTICSKRANDLCWAHWERQAIEEHGMDHDPIAHIHFEGTFDSSSASLPSPFAPAVCRSALSPSKLIMSPSLLNATPIKSTPSRACKPSLLRACDAVRRILNALRSPECGSPRGVGDDACGISGKFKGTTTRSNGAHELLIVVICLLIAGEGEILTTAEICQVQA